MLGGTLMRPSMSFGGIATQSVLSLYHVSKAFLSCKGVQAGHGVSDANEPGALVKQQMMRIADEVWLLADHSKFGRASLIRIAGLEEFAHIVTDPDVTPEQLDALGEHAGRVVVAE